MRRTDWKSLVQNGSLQKNEALKLTQPSEKWFQFFFGVILLTQIHRENVTVSNAIYALLSITFNAQ